MAANVWGVSWGGSTGSWLASWALESTPPVVVTVTGLSPAGAVVSKKRKRKVLVGNRMYEVDSLKDVEFLLKRIVRQEPIKAPVVPRKRVVDRVSADVVAEAPVALEIPSIAVDWSPLYRQLAVQDTAYADLLAKVLEKQEEDDIETLLLMI